MVMYGLLQSPRHNCQTFVLFEVQPDEDNIRMSTFVQNKLSVDSFENGSAFYEFVQEEDLLYYKEVVLLPTKPSVDEVMLDYYYS